MIVHRYLAIVKDRWFEIVVCTLLGALAAGLAAMVMPPAYTAKTKLYISAQNGNDAMSAYQGGMFAQGRVKSYTELISSERVASAVATQLSLPDPPPDLAREIVATSTLNTVVIDVAVTDRSPRKAEMIANGVGQFFPQLVAELEQPTDRNALPTVVARVVQPAGIPTRPSTPGLPIKLILGVIAGLLVGLGYAGIRNALANASETAPAETGAPEPSVAQGAPADGPGMGDGLGQGLGSSSGVALRTEPPISSGAEVTSGPASHDNTGNGIVPAVGR
jgi:capsular polysaccharide biosynthesis protein